MATERTVLVRLKANVDSFNKGMVEAAAAVKGLTSEIDSSSDRTAWLAQSILALAPAAVTLGAGAVPAIAGITTQMTVTAAAAGTLALAFHGIGGALTALNTYQLEPTATHLMKLHEAMGKIGPAGAQFVHFLDSIGGQLNGLSNTARAGLFPGMEDGIRHLLTLLPRVQVIVGQVAHGLGELTREAGKGLAGPKFEAFFLWLDRDAKPILMDMGRTIGNLAEGLANMLVAFGPQSLGFSHGLLQMSRAFAEWSRTLDTNQSFQAFISYINEAGPKALDFLGSLIDAGVELLKAWAPVGQVMLPMLTHLLDMLATLLATPLGPAVLGILALASAFGRLKAIAEITNSGVFSSFGKMSNGLVAQSKVLTSAFAKVEEGGTRAKYSIGQYGRAAGTVGIAAGAFGAIVSGQAEKFHLTNTAALAMAGTMVGPWGAAVGAGVGLVMDLASSHKKAIVSADDLTGTLNKETGAITKNTAAYVANQLQQSGILAQADALNISLPLVTKAALGNKAAITELTGVLDAYQGVSQPGYTVGGANVIDPEQAHAAGVLRDAIFEVSGVTTVAQKRQRQLAEALNFGTDASKKAAKAQQQLSAKTKLADQAASSTAAQFITLGKNVDNAKVSLDKWIHQMARDAQALIDFGNNARTAANKGLRDGLIKQLEAAGPTGALRMRQLANASESEIKKANGAYLSGQRAIEEYSATVTGIPNPNLNVNIDPAIRGINLVANALRNMPSSKTITINTRSTGGHVAYATGGYTGAGPKMEAAGIVHRGELVLPQEIVDRDWAKLKAQYGYLPGFANGGLVSGAQRANPGGGSQRQTVSLMVDEIPVRGTVDVNTGSFVGMAKVVATDVYNQQKDADDRHERAMNG